MAFIEPQRHPSDLAQLLGAFFAPDATVNVVHPLNDMRGGEVYERLFAPLQTAFEGLHRRTDILMSGMFEGGDWVSSTGYFVGHWTKPWLGLRPTGCLAYLRFGEFHRMEAGRAVESYIYLDLPELMTASGQWPIPTGPAASPGYRGLIPGPASQDGVIRSDQPRAVGEKSFQIVSDMLLQLATEDEGWRPYWHPNMAWYGPGAFGSFLGIENFASFQVPFESQFEGWSGGSKNNGMTRHFTRYGEGDYTCSGGWPSLTGVHVKPFLEQPVTGKRVFMRVCDWWRREGDLLVENWVFVDVPDVLRQLGRDVFES
ncbi:MAG: ester cyclase [Shimia sp.]